MLKKIPVHQLRLGMFIHAFSGAWIDHPFWRAKFLLADEEHLRKVTLSGLAEVWIDASRGLDIEAADSQVDAAPQSIAAPLRVPTASASDEAAQLLHRSIPRVAAMFTDARLGKALDLPGCEQLVDDIHASVVARPDALISVARLKRHDEYTYLHSIAVCALMIALGRNLGLNERMLKKAGLAGMLHDVGKARVPLALLNFPGKLSDAEFAVMRGHAALGHQLLAEGGGAGPVVLDVCLHHHERVDGSGYPQGLAGEQISSMARMAAICDVYDAITSDRPYKRAWSPAEALRQMAQWKGHFDTTIFQAFVRTVGIFPTGSLVRLRSGFLAVVTQQHPRTLLAPRVKAFYNLALRLREFPRDIDLSDDAHGDAVECYESPSDWPFRDLDVLAGLKPKS